MNADPDQLLHRLVVAALTVFVVVSLLLAAFVGRELWLQQRMAGLSSTLEVNLEDLEETTEEIQSEISELRTTPEHVQQPEGWDDVTELLEDLDQQLESIEENIDQVTTVLDPPAESATIGAEDAEAGMAVRDQANQVFTIFAVLTSLAALVIAVLLGMAIRIRDNIPSSESQQY